jgi:hypothetical protein
MTRQELISELRNLPRAEWESVKQAIDNREPAAADLDEERSPDEAPSNGDAEMPVTERELLEKMYAEGIIGNIPDLENYTDDDDEFEPIEVMGEPLSEMIIRERR